MNAVAAQYGLYDGTTVPYLLVKDEVARSNDREPL
jgi:hypothetical protein